MHDCYVTRRNYASALCQMCKILKRIINRNARVLKECSFVFLQRATINVVLVHIASEEFLYLSAASGH